MRRVSQIARRLLRHKKRKEALLSASLEDLMSQRQYVSYLQHPLRKVSFSSQSGDIKSAFKGRGMELEEIRPYSFGDDVRDIDWRVTARKQKPYTRLFAEERDREVYAVVDLSEKMRFGTKAELKSVSACKIMALLGWLALENKDRFGGMIFDGRQNLMFKAQNHRAGLLAMLKKVSDVSRDILKNEADTSSFSKTLLILSQNIKQNAVVFVVSDFVSSDETLQKSLALLAAKCDVFCLDVCDVVELYPPKAGVYMVENKQEQLVFDTTDPQFCEDYQKMFYQKRKIFEDFCRRFSCRYRQIRTDKSLFKQMQNGV